MQLYINPQGGIAGDIFTAGLIALGAPEQKVISRMEEAASDLGQSDIRTLPTKEGGKRLKIVLHSRQAHLEADEGKEILSRLFQKFNTPDAYRKLGLKIYEILLEAEQKAHSENIFSGDHYTVSPIGTAHSPYEDDAPFQPDSQAKGNFSIRIFPEYQEGLSHLDTFSHIMVFAYLDRSEGFSMKATPPWRNSPVGLFATRSPFRPNPVGFNILKLHDIKDGVLYTSPFDFLNKTPILDIKPAIGRLDKIEEANDGWVEGHTTDFHRHTHADHEHHHGAHSHHTHGHGHAHGHGHHGHVHERNTTFLHEAQDIIIDIIGAVTAMEELQLDTKAQLLQPVAAGDGTVSFSHGLLDVPAPATRAIFREYQIPWEKGPVKTELCTPTGAAILAALQATKVQEAPPLSRRGLARGSKELDIPPFEVGLK